VRRYITYLYKKIQKKRNINNKPDHKEKERYKKKKDIIYKKKKERKPEQKGVK
jgi:hypothetical protein